MKFLIHSNAPNVATGYGVQTGLLADRLVSAGHEVAISCTFGWQPGQGTTLWLSPSGHKIRLYPSGYTTPSVDVIHQHADHFFGLNRRSGWIVPLLDVWSLCGHPLLKEFNILAWAPVDHHPVPPGVLKFFAETGAVPLAMSCHGEQEFVKAGLEPLYAPLMVDTKEYRPTWHVGGTPAREFFRIPNGAFVVGMVAMNKDPRGRKSFPEAFRAFAQFQKSHPEAVLWVHSERSGIVGGLNLPRLADACGITEGTVAFSDPYGYHLGFPSDNVMPALLTCFDVLLAPSRGEGFCVPLIEAQACGVPVIASDFTAQSELVGAGWLVDGQEEWDEGSCSWYLTPSIPQIVARLEEAHAALQVDGGELLTAKASAFAAAYDADWCFHKYWTPILETLEGKPPADKPPMGDVAVLVPAMQRPQNVAPLVESFNATNDGTANLYFVVDADDDDEIAAIKDAGATYLIGDRGRTFAHKLNSGYQQTTESFIACVGDDVEFTEGWLAAVRALSDRYDVIGTNDSEPGRVRNREVAAGIHADHFVVRRSYVDDDGACLDGPGYLAPEAYFHYYVDKEIVQLAKARGVFSPCLDAHVIHHQPRYDGRADLWEADPVYVKGGQESEQDGKTFVSRIPLIEQARTVKVGIW